MTGRVDVGVFTQCQARIEFQNNATREKTTLEGSCSQVWEVIKDLALTMESFDIRLSGSNTPEYRYVASGIKPTEAQSFVAQLVIHRFAESREDCSAINWLLNEDRPF